MNISLNNIPVIIAPIASKHDGINIINEDSWIEFKLFFWKKGDVDTIDRYGPDGLSRLVKIISDKAVNFQSGYLYHYAFAMLIGFSILLTYLILY